jgi:hypothetical protein
MIEGKMNEHSAGWSTTFTGMRRAFAAAATARFTASSLVAAIASATPARSSSRNSAARCAIRPAARSALNPAISDGATTVTRAPARSSMAHLRAATSPPPATRQG